MDKILLKFFADVLYLKGLLCYEELNAIMDARTPADLDEIFENMYGEKYNVYKRGEVYTASLAPSMLGVSIDGGE